MKLHFTNLNYKMKTMQYYHNMMAFLQKRHSKIWINANDMQKYHLNTAEQMGYKATVMSERFREHNQHLTPQKKLIWTFLLKTNTALF